MFCAAMSIAEFTEGNDDEWIDTVGALVPDGVLRSSLSVLRVCPNDDTLRSRIKALTSAFQDGHAEVQAS